MVSVLWAVGLDLVRTVGFDLRRAVAASVRGAAPTRAAVLVARMVQPEDEVLAEDPSIYVALGRRPLVMDPFMLTRLDAPIPSGSTRAHRRIAERRFDLVVLVVPLDDRSFDFWWTDFHFGPRVADALRRAYQARRHRRPLFSVSARGMTSEAHGCDPRCPAVAPCRSTDGRLLICVVAVYLSRDLRDSRQLSRLERSGRSSGCPRDHRSSSTPGTSRPPGNASGSATTRCTRTRATRGAGR